MKKGNNGEKHKGSVELIVQWGNTSDLGQRVEGNIVAIQITRNTVN